MPNRSYPPAGFLGVHSKGILSGGELNASDLPPFPANKTVPKGELWQHRAVKAITSLFGPFH
jgi:hypothetical protein